MLVISGVSVKWALKFQVTEFHYSYCDAQTADDFSRPSTNPGTCKHKYLLHEKLATNKENMLTNTQKQSNKQTIKQMKNNPKTNKPIRNKKIQKQINKSKYKTSTKNKQVHKQTQRNK